MTRNTSKVSSTSAPVAAQFPKITMKTITIAEFINMPIDELNRLIDDHPSNNQNTGGLDIDLNGLSISDYVDKYDLLTINQVRENVMKKLNC